MIRPGNPIMIIISFEQRFINMNYCARARVCVSCARELPEKRQIVRKNRSFPTKGLFENFSRGEIGAGR